MNEELKAKLMEEAKKEGLNLAEDSVKKTIEFLFAAFPQIAAASENKIDDAVIPFLGLAKPLVMDLVDKIDGEEG